jgi:hypothetical protein
LAQRDPDKPSMDDKTRTSISRREFARRAALASAMASFAPVNAVNAGLPATPQTPPPPNTPRLSPEGQTEADARLQTILAQYGTRFSEDQKADLKRLCILAQPPLDRLRAYNLENGDSPALYLKPLVEREKKPKPPAAKSTGKPPADATPPAAQTPGAGKTPATGPAKTSSAPAVKAPAPDASKTPAPPTKKKP